MLSIHYNCRFFESSGWCILDITHRYLQGDEMLLMPGYVFELA